jgi:arsenate reductase
VDVAPQKVDAANFFFPMNNKVQEYCIERTKEFNRISEDRKKLLLDISKLIPANKEINLLYVCTHNSRRSTFGQIWGETAANFYGFDKVKCFSGGTEVTAFHPNALNAIKSVGFEVTSESSIDNPRHEVRFSTEDKPITCYSKTFDDVSNPSENFLALMTCGHADDHCPHITGTLARVPLRYIDPKISDGTPQQDCTYADRCAEIAREMLYLFSKIK